MINDLSQNPSQSTPAPVTMEALQAACSRLRKEHDAALAVAQEYEAGARELERRCRPKFVRAAERMSEAHRELHVLLAQSPHLFEKPKTQTFFDVRIGWMKGKGVVTIDGTEADVIARAEKLLPARQAEQVIKTTKKLVRKALSNLPGDVLRRLGVNLEDSGEAPFVKLVKGDGVKALEALVATGEPEE